MMASADEKPWGIAPAAHGYGLLVMLLKRTYVLPWSQFLYAEGTSEEVEAVFSMHNVVVKGSGLDPLLADFASQRITALQQPARTEKFTESDGPRIFAVEVNLVASGS